MADREQIEEWLARAGLNDRAAFAPLYEATSAKLFGLCLRVLGNRGEAEDALQEIYVKIWKGAGGYRVNGLSPISWMAAIARNHCIDRLRARRRRAETGTMPEESVLADAAPGPEARVVASGEARAIVDCMAELEARRAEAIRRAYLEGETYAELAARFDVPLNTMRTWLRRGLLALRACLERAA